MIRSFRSKPLRAFFEAGDSSKLPVQSPDRIRRQLAALDVASVPDQMDLPGWYLHRLQGKPLRWSVRVTANWRITFGFEGPDATAIDLEDYH